MSEARARLAAGSYRPAVASPLDRATLARSLELTPSSSMRGLCVRDGRGRIVAGVLYDGWLPNSVQAHMWVASPIACRHLLPHAFLYPFHEAGKGVLWSMIRASNSRSLALAKHLGFREEGRVRDGYAVGEDLVRVEMRREECRYLREAR